MKPACALIAAFLAVRGILPTSAAQAESLPTYIYDTPPSSLFKLSERPDHAVALATVLKGGILLWKDRNRTANHFCILGVQWDNGRFEIPVFWQEGKRLFYWEGNSELEEAYRSLLLSKGIDYEKDVVETRDDINGSTYLQVRSDVEALLRDCQAHGETVTIKPFRTPIPCRSGIDRCAPPYLGHLTDTPTPPINRKK